jgi:CubicO group peptidase (beta-lactamase class C family)
MKILTAILLGCVATAGSAQAPQLSKTDAGSAQMDSARLARIPARMQKFVDDGTAAGFVTLVARHGRIASLEAVGYLDREAKTPMRTDSIFRIKSMTKPMTAAGILLLVDEGKISLLDPVEQYLPEFKGLKLNPCGQPHRQQQPCDQPPTAPARLVTVRDLLTHTSGLRDPMGRPANPITTLAERVAAGAHGPLASQPGTEWSYCNFCYATLGRLIEVVSGQPYDVFMTKNLFEPLGMKDTYYFLPKEKQKRLATLYEFDAAGKLNPAGPQSGDKSATIIPGPDGGLFSTATDQLHFYQMLMNKGMFNGHRVLSIPAVEAMTTNQTGDLKGAEFSPGLGMGFGFGVVKEPLGTYRYQSIGSFMKGGAYRTLAWGDPARDLIGIILYQRTNGGGDTAPENTVFITLAEAAIAR